MCETNSIVPNVLKINLIIIVCSWKPQLYENHRFYLSSYFRLQTCLETQAPHKYANEAIASLEKRQNELNMTCL